MNTREYLISLYLDYVNNYLTIERYAECQGLTEAQAEVLITIARSVATTPHPDA